MKQIYLDYNATTPIAPSVIDAMLPLLREHHGNPSSSHSYGRAAAEAIEDARGKLAGVLGCDGDEIVFTSGGTEANNLAIKGAMLAGAPAGTGHMIISAFEHPAVTEPARFLERMGYDVSVANCDANGVVDLGHLQSLLREDTKLVSIMHANNEIGTIQPIRNIAKMCRERGILFHTDAAQSTGKIPVSVAELEVDMLTIAGHKFYGPKGVGALFVRKGIVLEPFMHGASHERGMRAGTENTPSIVGLATAAKLSHQCLDDTTEQLTKRRERLAKLLRNDIPDLIVHGEVAKRLPNTLSVAFPGVTGQDLLRRIPEVCASTGAACHSTGVAMSDTLKAIGISPEQASGTVRLSLGWYSNEEEIDRAASLLLDAWENLSVAKA